MASKNDTPVLKIGEVYPAELNIMAGNGRKQGSKEEELGEKLFGESENPEKLKNPNVRIISNKPQFPHHGYVTRVSACKEIEEVQNNDMWNDLDRGKDLGIFGFKVRKMPVGNHPLGPYWGHVKEWTSGDVDITKKLSKLPSKLSLNEAHLVINHDIISLGEVIFTGGANPLVKTYDSSGNVQFGYVVTRTGIGGFGEYVAKTESITKETLKEGDKILLAHHDKTNFFNFYTPVVYLKLEDSVLDGNNNIRASRLVNDGDTKFLDDLVVSEVRKDNNGLDYGISFVPMIASGGDREGKPIFRKVHIYGLTKDYKGSILPRVIMCSNGENFLQAKVLDKIGN